MNWKNKMASFVEEVLNDGLDDKVYTLIVDDENNFRLNFLNAQLLKTETLHSIAPHWKEHGKNLINRVIDMKIQKCLNKY